MRAYDCHCTTSEIVAQELEQVQEANLIATHDRCAWEGVVERAGVQGQSRLETKGTK